MVSSKNVSPQTGTFFAYFLWWGQIIHDKGHRLINNTPSPEKLNDYISPPASLFLWERRIIPPLYFVEMGVVKFPGPIKNYHNFYRFCRLGSEYYL